MTSLAGSAAAEVSARERPGQRVWLQGPQQLQPRSSTKPQAADSKLLPQASQGRWGQTWFTQSAHMPRKGLISSTPRSPCWVEIPCHQLWQCFVLTPSPWNQLTWDLRPLRSPQGQVCPGLFPSTLSNVWQIIGIQRVSNMETIPPPRIFFHSLRPVEMDPPCREQLKFYLILEAFSSFKCVCCISCRLIEFNRTLAGMSWQE